MWSTLLFVFVLGVLVRLSIASIGVSLSKSLDTSGWSALVTATPTIASASIHIMFYNGSINPNAIPTIKSAWSANIRDLSVYMHPCLNTSVYSVQYNVACGSARYQFQQILSRLSEQDVSFSHHLSSTPTVSNTPSAKPTAMPTRAPTAQMTGSPTAGVTVKRLFVCFEDEVPNRYMSNNHFENVNFMLELQHEAVSHGVQLGIYTTKNEWLNIMTVNGSTTYPLDADGSTFASINPFSDLPLWTPRFDSVNSMAFYAPFGNWSRVFMKEVSGSTTALHRIGSDRVGMTFVDDTVGTQFYSNQILEYIVS